MYLLYIMLVEQLQNTAVLNHSFRLDHFLSASFTLLTDTIFVKPFFLFLAVGFV